MIVFYPKPIPGRPGPRGDSVVVPGGPPGTPGTNLVPFRLVYPASAIVVVDGLSGFTRVGAIPFDPSVLYQGATVVRRLKFQTAAEVTFGVTAEITLYDPAAGAYIAGSTVTVTSTTPVVQETSELVPGGASTSVKLSAKIYEVHARITVPGSPVPGDLVRVFSHNIIADFTASLEG